MVDLSITLALPTAQIRFERPPDARLTPDVCALSIAWAGIEDVAYFQCDALVSPEGM